MKDPQHPRQPVVIDEEGRARFKANLLVRLLLDTGKLTMGDLAVLPGIAREEHEQLAQLIGYTVDGAAELPYMSRELIADADAQVRNLRAQQKD